MKLYHSPKTRSARVVWLLNELGDVQCEVIERPFRMPLDGLFSQDAPAGKFPTLTDGDTTIFKSGAIVQYVLDKYGNGRLQPPLASANRGQFLQWMYFAEGSGAVPLNLIGWYGFVKRDDPRFAPVVEEMKGWAASALRQLESGLEGRRYLLGDEFSAADIMVGYTVNMAKNFGVPLQDYASINAWFAAVTSRPAFVQAMSK